LTFPGGGFPGRVRDASDSSTSGPLARALADLDDTGRDIHLTPRAAQFRIEMRLLAVTLQSVAHIPRRVAAYAISMTARAVFFVWELLAISAVIQIGLALPMVVYFHRLGLSGLSANVFVVPLMGLAVPAGFVAVATDGIGWRPSRLAAAGVAHDCGVARGP